MSELLVFKYGEEEIISGIIESERTLKRLLYNLERLGYGKERVSVVMSDGTTEVEPSPESTLVGGLGGGVIGAVLGGVAMTTYPIVLPEIPFIGFTLGVITGCTLGSYLGALLGKTPVLNKTGNILVSVKVLPTQLAEVKSLFILHGIPRSSG
jgi:hypothetical protein